MPATLGIIPCRSEKLKSLLYKAKQILAEGECDCGCTECPAIFVCTDPDMPPYSMLKEFLWHNEEQVLDDEKLNRSVNRDNLNSLQDI